MSEVYTAVKERKTALAAAVEYLARRAYTEKEIRDKLRRKAYTGTETDDAVDTLKRRGYLNDAELCRSLLAQYSKESSYSMRYIRVKLMQKGFGAEVVAESAQEFLDEEREITVASKVLRRKYSSSGEIDPRSAANYLYGKGFGPETIRRAVAGLDDFDEM